MRKIKILFTILTILSLFNWYFVPTANAAITEFKDQETEAEGVGIGHGDSGSNRAYRCQTFKATYTTINGFAFDLNSTGTAGMVAWLDDAVASGEPTGTWEVGLGQKEILNAALSTSRTQYSFDTPITVTPGNIYALCLAPWNTSTHVWTSDYRDLDHSVSNVYTLGRSITTEAAATRWTVHDSGNADLDMIIYGNETNADVVIDSISESAKIAAASSITFAHTTIAGSNTGICVGVESRDADGGHINVSTVTFNAVTVDLVRRDETSAGFQASELWCLATPDVGTYNVIVTYTSTVDHGHAFAIGFSGADTADLSAGSNGATSTSAADATVTVTTDTDNCLLLDTMYSDSASTVTPGTSQRQKDASKPNTFGDTAAGSTRETTSAGGYALTWDWTDATDSNYAQSAMCIKPVSVAAAASGPSTDDFILITQ